MKNSNKISLAGVALFGAVFTLSSFLAVPKALPQPTTTMYVQAAPSDQALAQLNAQARKLGGQTVAIQTVAGGYQLSLTGGSVLGNSIRLERIAKHFAAREIMARYPLTSARELSLASAKPAARLALEVQSAIDSLAADARRLQREQAQTTARLLQARAGLRQLELAAAEALASANNAAQLKAVREARAQMEIERATITRGLKPAHPLVAEYAGKVAALAAQERALVGQIADTRDFRISAANKEITFLSHQLETTNARLAAITSEQNKVARGQHILAAGRDVASVN